MVNSEINNQSPKDKNDGLPPNHGLKTPFPFPPASLKCEIIFCPHLERERYFCFQEG